MVHGAYSVETDEQMVEGVAEHDSPPFNAAFLSAFRRLHGSS